MEAMQDAKITNPHIFIKTLLLTRKQIKILIQDNGAGFCQKIAKQLFQAYFTTKAQGTGLGLAICHSVIEAHGGEIFAVNLAKGGSSFEFTLPIKRDSYE